MIWVLRVGAQYDLGDNKLADAVVDSMRAHKYSPTYLYRWV